ncbi:MAG: hypothetical protein HYV97_05305 [Bdellovibrio sp.]|nr:hypothetical protein [Bdellovibrio sp.]
MNENLNSMKIVPLIFIIFYSASITACNLAPENDWFLPIATIYAKTQQVFVGKVVNIHDLCTTDGPVRDPIESQKLFEKQQKTGCYSYSFIVQKKIKGTFKEGDTVQVHGRLRGRSNEKISYGRDCGIDLGFNSSEIYLIFLNAFHPDAYRKVESIGSPWVKENIRF